MKRYVVKLTKEERLDLQTLVSTGKSAARGLTHARILLLVDAGAEGPKKTSEETCEALGTSLSTVYRVRQRLVEEGLEQALTHKSPPRRPIKIDTEVEKKIVELAGEDPPDGRKRWTLRLLADKAVELKMTPSVSHESVRTVLKKTNCGLGKRRSGVSLPRPTPNLCSGWKT